MSNLMRPHAHVISRRAVLKGAAAGAAAVAAGGLFAPAVRAAGPVKIGYVTPQSGPLAPFGEADTFVIDTVGRLAGDAVQIIVKDSRSDPDAAAAATKALIGEGVSLMLAAATPETTNPVATVCEAEHVPCITTNAPWQPWYIGRQDNPADPASWRNFRYTYHYFWGLEDLVAVFAAMWGQLETNKTVGALFPDDGDGNAWADPAVGIAPRFAQAGGYTVVDAGRYRNLSGDFSAQIAALKGARAEIVTGPVVPPDFPTFWTQARQQGFRPKAVTVAKALLFPSSVEALGPAGHNLSSEVWWSPGHPFASSLTGQTCRQLADAFTAASGRPWTQPIGFVHSIFEVALDVIRRAGDARDPEMVVGAIQATDLDTIAGRVHWSADGELGPIGANVCKTPLVGGQWRTRGTRDPDDWIVVDGKWRLRDEGNAFDLVIVDNSHAPQIPAAGTMEPLSYA